MENNIKNYPNMTPKDNPAGHSSLPDTTAKSQGASLNKKREELLSSGGINDEVSDYLNKLDKKDYPLTTENLARGTAEKVIPKQSIIRTFKSDTEKAIELEHMSSIRIALAEQKKKQEYQPIAEPVETPRSKKWFVLIISLFFIFAGIGAFNLNYIKEKFNPAPKNKIEVSTLITVDSSREINLSEIGKKDLNSLLSESISSANVTKNSIQNIYITENENLVGKEKVTSKAIESKKFLYLINSRMPDSLLRSLMPEYMLGIHSWNGNQPFIILKTDSYENAFAGMLAWEKYMKEDLNALFSLNNRLSSGEASTTTRQIYAYQKDFEDILIKNKDARALKDSDGNIFLIYSLPDKETIIITSNADTLAELFDRAIRLRAVR